MSLTSDEVIKKLLKAIDDVGDYNDGCGCCGTGTRVSNDTDVQSAVSDAESYLNEAPNIEYNHAQTARLKNLYFNTLIEISPLVTTKGFTPENVIEGVKKLVEKCKETV